ncbi:hypothetical protein [Spirosoma gilvum]
MRTTNNINYGGFPFSTTYNYTSDGQVGSFVTSMNTRGVFVYDGQNRPTQLTYYYQMTDESEGEVTQFTYNANEFTVNTTHVKNGITLNTLRSANYQLDQNGHLISLTIYGNPNRVDTYTYAGDNIVRVTSTTGTMTTITLYEYDDKINPYFGKVAPDIGEIRRFSRNNVIKITNGPAVSEYTYTYNSEGLPSKMKEKNGVGEVQYTYWAD